MKTLESIIIFIVLLNLGCAQNANKSLDGKSFQISGWDVNHPEKQDPDLLVFKNGMMDSESCHQYGFTAAPYQATNNNGVWSFSCTIKSPTEGEMNLEGEIRENKITGSYIWKKTGQDDIKYEYKGELKN